MDRTSRRSVLVVGQGADHETSHSSDCQPMAAQTPDEVAGVLTPCEGASGVDAALEEQYGLQWQAHFHAILNLMDASLSSLDPDALLHSMLDSLATMLSADVVVGAILEDSSLFARVALPMGVEALSENRIPLGRGLSGHCAESRKAVRGVAGADGLVDAPDFLSAQKLRSVVAIPMMADEQVIGVVEVGWSDYECTESQTHLLERLCARFAVALTNAHTYEMARQAERLSHALTDIVSDINSTRDTDEIMRRVVVDAAAALGCETAAIDIRYDGGWIPQYVHGFPEEAIGKWFSDSEVPFAAYASRTGEVVAISDCETDDRVDHEVQRAYNVRAVLLAPLVVRGVTIGAIFFNYHSKPKRFIRPEMDFAHKLGVAVALAMDNARLYESLLASEKAEEKQRKFVEMLLDSAPIGIAVVGCAGYRLELANDWFSSAVRAGSAQVVGRELAGVCPELADNGAHARIEAVRATRRMVRAREMRWTPGQGKQPNHWDVTYVPLQDEAGEVGQVLIIVRDVTQEVANRLSTQALAQRSVEELSKREAILSSIMEGIIIFDMRGYVVDMNPAALQMHGFASVEEVQRHLMEFSHAFHLWDEDGTMLPVEMWPMGRVLRGETFKDVEVRVKRLADKQESFWSYSGSVVRDVDGEVGLGVLTVRDVTALRNAQTELARATEVAERRAVQQEALVAGLTDAVVLVDEHGKAILVNQAAKEMLGVRSDGELWDWLTDFQHYTLDGDEFNVSQTPSYRALRGETVRDMTYVVVTPSGQSVTVCSSASPVRDTQGRIIGSASVLRDVTESVAFERRRTEMYEREHRISTVLQEALIPSGVPRKIGEYEIAVRYKSALQEAHVGGDFYDVFELGEGKFGVLIGDVAGKGLAAAARVAAVRHSVRSYAYLDPAPATVLSLANDALCRDDDDLSGMLTALFAVVDTHSGVVTYACAGHEPPVSVTADGTCRELDSGSFPLGVSPGVIYSEVRHEMLQGSLLVMVTDGITEARVFGGELFGKRGIAGCVAQAQHAHPEEVATCLLDSASSHADGCLQDDVAIIVLKRTKRPPDGRSYSDSRIRAHM